MPNLVKNNINNYGFTQAPAFYEKSGAGFTLIETLIYIAFLAILMGSLLGIAFQTIAGTDQINKKIVLQQESNFILRKIDWALTSATSVSIGPGGSSITITRSKVPITVVFSQNGNYINIDTGSGVKPLNSDNVSISNIVFSKTSTQPVKVQASFTVTYTNSATNNSQSFQLTKYLRK